jgi:hypothetical protein
MKRRLAVMLGIPAIALGVSISGYQIVTASGGLNTGGHTHAIPAISSTCSGTHIWAVVNADGTRARAGGACSGTTTSGSNGSCDVVFPRNVSNCAYVAVIGSPARSGTVAAGYATVVGAAISVDGVFVQTWNSSGVLAAQGFHLIVDC